MLPGFPRIKLRPLGSHRNTFGSPAPLVMLQTVVFEARKPVARLLDDPGLRQDEGPAPHRSVSSLWEPDVGPDDPSPYAPQRVRDAASGKRSTEFTKRSDTAKAVVFLASEGAAGVTGQTIPVTGWGL